MWDISKHGEQYGTACTAVNQLKTSLFALHKNPHPLHQQPILHLIDKSTFPNVNVRIWNKKTCKQEFSSTNYNLYCISIGIDALRGWETLIYS